MPPAADAHPTNYSVEISESESRTDPPRHGLHKEWLCVRENFCTPSRRLAPLGFGPLRACGGRSLPRPGRRPPDMQRAGDGRVVPPSPANCRPSCLSGGVPLTRCASSSAAARSAASTRAAAISATPRRRDRVASSGGPWGGHRQLGTHRSSRLDTLSDVDADKAATRRSRRAAKPRTCDAQRAGLVTPLHRAGHIAVDRRGHECASSSAT